MSARISGLKNEVAWGVSVVRALPVSQVKSPKAKGSALAALPIAVPPDFPFSVACPCGPITRLLKLEFKLEIVFVGVTVAGVAAVAPSGVATLIAGSFVPGCETV